MSLELAYPRVVRQPPVVEAADGGEYKVCLLLERLFFLAQICPGDGPFGVLIVPSDVFDLSRKLDILVHVVFSCLCLPVVTDFVAFGKLL